MLESEYDFLPLEARERLDALLAREDLLAEEDLELKQKLERKFERIAGDVEVNFDTLFYTFLSPQIARQFMVSSLLTMEAFVRGVENHDPSSLREHVFLVGHSSEKGMIASPLISLPAEFGDRGNVRTVFPSSEEIGTDFQAIMIVHTHPPSDGLLRPSVIGSHEGISMGDLYSLTKIPLAKTKIPWQNSVFLERGRGASFAERPIFVIIETFLSKEVVKLLFLRETEELSRVGEQEYLDKLKSHRPLIEALEYPGELCGMLEEMGYRAAYVEIPDERFFNVPIVEPQHLDVIFTILKE